MDCFTASSHKITINDNKRKTKKAKWRSWQFYYYFHPLWSSAMLPEATTRAIITYAVKTTMTTSQWSENYQTHASPHAPTTSAAIKIAITIEPCPMKSMDGDIPLKNVRRHVRKKVICTLLVSGGGRYVYKTACLLWTLSLFIVCISLEEDDIGFLCCMWSSIYDLSRFCASLLTLHFLL